MSFISVSIEFLPIYSLANIHSGTQVSSSNTSETEIMLDLAVIKNNDFNLMFCNFSYLKSNVLKILSH